MVEICKGSGGETCGKKPRGDPDLDGRMILRWMEGRDLHRFLVGKLEGKRSLGNPRRRWENNIKLDL
jgi:hypothetical protein